MSENTKNLIEKFRTYQSLIARYVHRKRREHDIYADPHRGQGRVLTLLKMQPEISQKDLAYLLDIRTQSLGELLNKLEKSGFITKTPSQEDKRVTLIRLTDIGRQAAEKTTEQQMDMDNLFSCLSDDEQETLSELLSRLCNHLQEQIGEDANEPGHPLHPRHEEHFFMGDHFCHRREGFENHPDQHPHDAARRPHPFRS